jgi:hypothetical protein
MDSGLSWSDRIEAFGWFGWLLFGPARRGFTLPFCVISCLRARSGNGSNPWDGSAGRSRLRACDRWNQSPSATPSPGEQPPPPVVLRPGHFDSQPIHLKSVIVNYSFRRGTFFVRTARRMTAEEPRVCYKSAVGRSLLTKRKGRPACDRASCREDGPLANLEGAPACGKLNDMAKVVLDPRTLPERTVPIPGAKPPVTSFPYKDLGHPEEVDSFRLLIRELRRHQPTLPRPSK